jgi:hypothetical protein
MTLLSRLLALESVTSPGGCRTCQDWGWRILYPDEPTGEPEEGWRKRTPPPPEQCPDCGRETPTIRICYYDVPGRFGDEAAINVTLALGRDHEGHP